MKKGNVGVVLQMLGKKVRESVNSRVDLGLTGKDGVVHPSLAVRSRSPLSPFTHKLSVVTCAVELQVFALKQRVADL